MSLLLQVCETNAEVSNKTKPKPQDHVETEVLYRQKSIISLSEKVIVGDVIRTDDNEEFCVDDEDDLQYKPVTRKSVCIMYHKYGEHAAERTYILNASFCFFLSLKFLYSFFTRLC